LLFQEIAAPDISAGDQSHIVLRGTNGTSTPLFVNDSSGSRYFDTMFLPMENQLKFRRDSELKLGIMPARQSVAIDRSNACFIRTLIIFSCVFERVFLYCCHQPAIVVAKVSAGC